MAADNEPILSIRDLRTYFRTDDGVVKAVDGVSFDLQPGETLGIVGESGSGKTVTCLSAMRLVPQPPGFFPSGEILFAGQDMLKLSPSELVSLRGDQMSMIFQDPMTSLNPFLRIDRQLSEVLEVHQGLPRQDARRRSIEMLDRVGIPDPQQRIDQFPHQFSGGMRQRVMIAMALLCEPKLLVADEPTTALDVTIQAQILDLIRDLKRDFQTSVILITHDLGIVAGTTDRIAVMYAGRIVEEGPTDEVFANPLHPYTRGLLRSVPRLDELRKDELQAIPGLPPDLSALPSGCPFHPRCDCAAARCADDYPDAVHFSSNRWAACWDIETIMNRNPPQSLLQLDDLKVHFPVRRGTLIQRQVGTVRAVDGVCLEVRRGETLGLVGESGCGKSTTGQAILQLLRPTSGSVTFDHEELTVHWQHRWGRWTWDAELRTLRQRMQMIFQDPYASLNPRMTVESIVGEPLRSFDRARGIERRRQVQDLMRRVGMDPRYIRRYPHEFSGGQRQRIGIARALALEPELIIADEPISALDVSIQAQILNLLQQLQHDLKLTYVFIAHDLAAVRHISDRIAVMYLGRIVELADRDSIYHGPAHPYTQALISAVPVPDPQVERTRKRIVLSGDVPSPMNPPPGCPFHTRCPVKEERCQHEVPLLREVAPGHFASCHLA